MNTTELISLSEIIRQFEYRFGIRKSTFYTFNRRMFPLMTLADLRKRGRNKLFMNRDAYNLIVQNWLERGFISEDEIEFDKNKRKDASSRKK